MNTKILVEKLKVLANELEDKEGFELVNLLPHELTIKVGNDVLKVPPEGKPARVSSTPGKLGKINIKGLGEIDIGEPTQFGKVESLPAPKKGVLYVVSALVGVALAGTRSDVVMPGTGPTEGVVRDDKGQVKYVTRLVRAN